MFTQTCLLHVSTEYHSIVTSIETMAVKNVSVLILVIFTAYYVQNTVAFPRDGTIERSEEVIINRNDAVLSLPKVAPTTITQTDEKSNAKSSLRVSCEFAEVTEAAICQEHCVPKGYSYGLCVGYTCSCI